MKPILIVFFLAFIVFAVWDLSQKISDKKEISKRLQSLPVLDVFDLNATVYEQDRHSNTPTLIIYFNSACDYCQREVENIEENISSFDETNILFISSETIEAITLFQCQYDFGNSPRVKFLKINEDKVVPTFGAVSVPHLFIYGKNGELVKEYMGETKIEVIIKHISSR